jgi:tetratricopeptide (TPR) repeat protein
VIIILGRNIYKKILLICLVFTVICCERSSKIIDDRDMFLQLRFNNDIEDIQSCFLIWFNNINDDELLEQVKLLAEKLFNYYPNSVYSHYNLAVYYFKKEDHQEALKYYLQAENIENKNIHVLIGL